MDLKYWDTLSRQEQNLYLTLLWEDGYSESAIAKFLHTTKGTIVRRRHTGLSLTTEGRPSPAHVKQTVDLERFGDLLDLHAMDELEKKGVVVMTPPATTCKWPVHDRASIKPALCGKPAVPGHELCQAHLNAVLRRR